LVLLRINSNFASLLWEMYLDQFPPQIKKLTLRGLESPLLLAMQAIMMDKKRIEKILEDYLQESGKFVVDLQISTGNVIQIALDSDTGIMIEDCVDMTRFFEKTFDREEEDYELKVSSYGIDKPLLILRQYNKVIGRDILVKIKEGIEKRARLENANKNGITITYQLKKGGAKQKEQAFKDGDTETLTFDDIEYVKEIICF